MSTRSTARAQLAPQAPIAAQLAAQLNYPFAPAVQLAPGSMSTSPSMYEGTLAALSPSAAGKPASSTSRPILRSSERYGYMPDHVRRQPLIHTVAAFITYGCSPDCIRPQPSSSSHTATAPMAFAFGYSLDHTRSSLGSPASSRPFLLVSEEEEKRMSCLRT